MNRVDPNRNVYVGHRYVPLLVGEWDKSIQYEGLSIVTFEGGSYTSKKMTPPGIDIGNEEYWVMTANYNAQVEYYRQETERVSDSLEEKADKQELIDFQGDVNNQISYFKTETNENIDDFKDEVNTVTDELNVKTEPVPLNVKIFGALGDGVTDDVDSIQNAINYAYENGGHEVYFPNGEYLISKPVFVPSDTSNTPTQQGSRIRFENPRKTKLIKYTNDTLGSDYDGYSDIDAVMIIGGFTKKHEDTTWYVELENVYLESTAPNIVEYGFYSNKLSQSHLKNCSVDGGNEINRGFSTGLSWQNYIVNMKIRAIEVGLEFRNGGTSNHLDTCFMIGSKIGYILRGAYSSASSLAADHIKEVSYKLHFASWTLNSPGSESTVSDSLFDISNSSSVTLNSPGLSVSNLNDNGQIFKISNSNVVLNGVSLPDTVNGRLYSITNNSHLIINGLDNADYTHDNNITNRASVMLNSKNGTVYHSREVTESPLFITTNAPFTARERPPVDIINHKDIDPSEFSWIESGFKKGDYMHSNKNGVLGYRFKNDTSSGVPRSTQYEIDYVNENDQYVKRGNGLETVTLNPYSSSSSYEIGYFITSGGVSSGWQSGKLYITARDGDVFLRENVGNGSITDEALNVSESDGVFTITIDLSANYSSMYNYLFDVKQYNL